MKTPRVIHEEVKSYFAEMSRSYDKITFLRKISLRLVELANLKLGRKVLDIATGTVTVAFPVAQKAGFSGKVVGVDFSFGDVGDCPA